MSDFNFYITDVYKCQILPLIFDDYVSASNYVNQAWSNGLIPTSATWIVVSPQLKNPYDWSEHKLTK
jgi:hypothetical protein